VRGARALVLTLLFACGIAAPAASQLLPDAALGNRPDTLALPLPPPDLDAFEGPIDPATYVLGPGDGLMLDVLGSVTMQFALGVDPEGNVWVPDRDRSTSRARRSTRPGPTSGASSRADRVGSLSTCA
jgi:protein involved in polysaccharide export with SLBB domain